MNRSSALLLAVALSAANSPTLLRAQATTTAPSTSVGTGASGTNIGTGGGASNTVGRAPVTTLPTTPSTNTNTPVDSISRPIFLSGKVMMDDGSPVPPNVVIQQVCSGSPHSVAYTDTRGHFSFQFGQSNGMVMDASEASADRRSSGGFGSAQSAGGSNPLSSNPFKSQMNGCELRADLPGYRSTVATLFNRTSMDNPDVGTIILHRMGASEGTSVSATSLMAPKDARKAYEHGLQSLLKNKTADAQKDFEKAVAAYPKYADAWLNLGKVQRMHNALEPARESMLKAIEADAKLVGPYIELGLMAAMEKKWEDAGQYLDKGLKLDPIDFPNAWYADAVANFNLKKYDAAEKACRETVKLDLKHANPKAQFLLGMILIEKKDYAGATEQYREFVKRAPNAPEIDTVKDQLSQMEKFLADTKVAGAQP
jgi:tetratricopeptide (TPR) repeat protein